MPTRLPTPSPPADLRVVAVYPTFAILGWNAPVYRGDREGAASTRVVWHYTVEWSCSCGPSQTTRHDSVTPPPYHLSVIPLTHPGEVHHVQVFAKGTVGTSIVSQAVLKSSFRADCNVAFPWLQPRALHSPLLYHSLCIATSAGNPRAASEIPGPITTAYDGVWLLDSGLVVSSHKVLYATAPAPMRTRCSLILTALAVGQAAATAKGAQRLTSALLMAQLVEEDASVLLCGIGELGGSAALATYALMSSLCASGSSPEEVAARVFCVAYGAARRCLQETSPALAVAGQMSGNVVYYTGLMAPTSLDGGGCTAFTHAMFASGVPPALPASQQQRLSPSLSLERPQWAAIAPAQPESRGLPAVPLGTRAGPVLDPCSGEVILVGEASSMDAPTDEEQCECIDTAFHLSLLERLVSAEEASIKQPPHTDSSLDEFFSDCCGGGLVPVIDAVTFSLVDRTSSALRVFVGGRHLQYNPKVICVTAPGDIPLTTKLLSCSPDEVVCEASLIPAICAASFASLSANSRTPPTSLAVSLVLQTDLGVTSRSRYATCVEGDALMGNGGGTPTPGLDAGARSSGAVDTEKMQEGLYTVQLPSSVTELLFKACRARATADAWITGYPVSLVSAIVSALPFNALSASFRDVSAIERRLTTDRSIAYATDIATAAEIVTSYQSRAAANGLVAWVERVSAKISSQPKVATRGMTLMPVMLKEKKCLLAALKSLVMSSTMPISTYLAQMISWKKRLFTGLPALNENQYRSKLQWLLLVLGETDTLCREQPLTALELQLYSCVAQYLRVRLEEKNGRTMVNMSFVVTENLSFSEFFDLTHGLFLPLFLNSSTIEERETAVVTEVGMLWAVCAIVQLRNENTVAAQFTIAVTGCRGSGVSTVATALTAVCNDLNTSSTREGKRLPRLVVRQVPENGLALLRERMKLGMAVSVVMTAELPDFGGLAFSAITRSLQDSITNAESQRLHVVLSKVDERLSLLGAEDAAAPTGAAGASQVVAALARAATVTATAAAAQSCKNKWVPVPVALAPSLASVRSTLKSAHSNVSEEEFAAELLHQSIERLRDLVLRDTSPP